MKITIHPEVLKELEYITKLHRGHGAANQFENVPDLVGYILASIADGSRRPGSWERTMLESMGLEADCDEHRQFRANYGEAD